MRRLATTLVLLTIAHAAHAQCANGAPPPCAGAAAPRAAIPIDANRVAVFPFRVTTADTLLGEGFAELLSNEFTGEGSPRAVNMATTISAWRRAGGGLRSPLPLDNARRIAREAGAGLLVEGSIVGLGGSVTISASLVASQDGAIRGVPVRITGTPDSLTTLINRVAAGILASAGSRHVETGARYSDSTSAMREFIQGLNAWRRSDLEAGVQAFDRAIAIDSSFAQALFWRYLAVSWGFGNRGALVTRLAWDARTRLSRPQRMVLEAVLGINYPAPRTIDQRAADRRRAAELLSDSPDALYFYGDFMYHYGVALEPRHLEIARDYLTRAAAIDSQITVVRHLVEIGVMLRDTALLRQATPVYARAGESDERWCYEWASAAELRDGVALTGLRRRLPAGIGACRVFAPFSSAPSVMDEAFTRVAESSTGSVRDNVLVAQAATYVNRGRPAAAERVLAKVSDAMRADAARIGSAVSGFGPGLDVDGAMKRVLAGSDGTNSAVNARCAAAQYRVAMTFGAVPPVSHNLDALQCPGLVFLDSVARVLDQPGTLEGLDSLARNDVNPGSGVAEAFMIASAWEKRGQPAKALRAIRSRTNGFGNEAVSVTWATEARLALVVGDTAGAVNAFRHLADLLLNAEPPYTAQRDSARAIVARLERRQPRP
jgi:hypothetical protein